MSIKKENIKNISFDKKTMTLIFADGRKVSVPLAIYPRLYGAETKHRKNWKIIGQCRGIHWPDLDEDLSIEGILHGIPSVEYRKPRRLRNKTTPNELRV